jgi:hypothetical protein
MYSGLNPVKKFQKIPAGSKIFQNLPKCSKMSKNNPKIIQNVSN